MISAFDRVILTDDLAAEGLRQGDIGTVVEIYRDGEGYEVEFFTLQGETRAVVTLLAHQVREISPKDVPNARTVEALPRTPYGKVVKGELVKQWEAEAGSSDPAAPATDKH